MGFEERFLFLAFASTTPAPASFKAKADKVTITETTSGDLDARISAVSNDSSNSPSAFSNTSNNNTAGLWDSNSQYSAMRFTGITIPAGATITTAYITFTARFSRTAQTIASKIYGEKTATPAAYGSTEDFTSRDLTTANVSYVPAAAWTLDEEYVTPELKTIIQELVDAYGAYSNGSIALQWLDNGTAGTYNAQLAYSYDSAPAKAPLLHIEYTYPVTLTKTYLFQYTHITESAKGYLWIAALGNQAPEVFFSVNDFDTQGIEFTRLGAAEMKVYYDGVLKTTFPAAPNELTLYNGYYRLTPIPA